jgi:hypothetical protein
MLAQHRQWWKKRKSKKVKTDFIANLWNWALLLKILEPIEKFFDKMQGISAVLETRVAIKATIPAKINSNSLPCPCFKLPRLALQSAGVALAASTVLVFTPVDANAAPTLTYAPPSVKASLEVGHTF